MIERHIGDDTQQGRPDDIGAVQITAHTAFNDRNSAMLLRKQKICRRCKNFKLRRRFGHLRFCGGNLRHQFCKMRFADFLCIDPEIVCHGCDRRRRKMPRPESCLCQHRSQHGTDGTFAVGSGNVDYLQFLLRIAENRRKLLHSLQSEL